VCRYAKQLQPLIAALRRYLPALRAKGALPYTDVVNWDCDPDFDYNLTRIAQPQPEPQLKPGRERAGSERRGARMEVGVDGSAERGRGGGDDAAKKDEDEEEDEEEEDEEVEETEQVTDDDAYDDSEGDEGDDADDEEEDEYDDEEEEDEYEDDEEDDEKDEKDEEGEDDEDDEDEDTAPRKHPGRRRRRGGGERWRPPFRTYGRSELLRIQRWVRGRLRELEGRRGGGRGARRSRRDDDEEEEDDEEYEDEEDEEEEDEEASPRGRSRPRPAARAKRPTQSPCSRDTASRGMKNKANTKATAATGATTKGTSGAAAYERPLAALYRRYQDPHQALPGLMEAAQWGHFLPAMATSWTHRRCVPPAISLNHAAPSHTALATTQSHVSTSLPSLSPPPPPPTTPPPLPFPTPPFFPLVLPGAPPPPRGGGGGGGCRAAPRRAAPPGAPPFGGAREM